MGQKLAGTVWTSGGVLCVQDADAKMYLCPEEKEQMDGETVDVRERVGNRRGKFLRTQKKM